MTLSENSTVLSGSDQTFSACATVRNPVQERVWLVGSMGISDPSLQGWSEIEKDCLIRIISNLGSPRRSRSNVLDRTERYARLIARMESWAEEDSGYDARVWPLVKKVIIAHPVKCREPKR